VRCVTEVLCKIICFIYHWYGLSPSAVYKWSCVISSSVQNYRNNFGLLILHCWSNVNFLFLQKNVHTCVRMWVLIVHYGTAADSWPPESNKSVFRCGCFGLTSAIPDHFQMHQGLAKSVFSEHGWQQTINFIVDIFEGSMQSMRGAEVTQSAGRKPIQQQLRTWNEVCQTAVYVHNFAVDWVIAMVVDLVTVW